MAYMGKYHLSSGYSCIINTLCKKGMLERAMEVFQNNILRRGLFLSNSSFRILLQTQFRENQTKGVFYLLQLVDKTEADLQYMAYSNSIAFLCEKGCFDAALNVYTLTRKKGSGIADRSYYVILKNLLDTEQVHLALPILNSYLKEYGMFGRRIINIIILILCRKSVDTAISFLTDLGLEKVSAVTSTRVVKFLVKEGSPQDARKFILEAGVGATTSDVVSYSMIIDAFCKEGHLEKALDLCAVMKQKGIHPNIVTYNSIINCLCRQGCLTEAFRLFDALERNNIQATSITYGILIDALTREGYMKDADKLLQRMRSEQVDPNLHILNSLIYGYSNLGLMDESLQLFGDLEKNDLKPDPFTISALISGFYLNGDIEGALGFYSSCKRKSFLPDIFGFTLLTKGLCRNGRMEEARSILKNMLQSPPVTSLINDAGNDIGMELLASILDVLSEEGRIKDAIKLLSGITYVCFPSGRHNRFAATNNLRKDSASTVTRDSKVLTACGMQQKVTDCLHINCNTEDTLERAIEFDKKGRNHDMHEHTTVVNMHDFDTYYHLISSFCSEAETKKASNAVGEMLLNFSQRS